MQHDNKTFIPALQYAARHDLSIDNVIKMIKDGSLSGRSEEVSTDYGIETRWFVEVESSETEGVEYRFDRIHEEGGDQQRTAGENVSGKPDVPLVLPLRIIGIVSIIFGAIAGIALLIIFMQPTSFLFVQSKAELTFGEFVIAVGITLFYCALGVSCLGIAKVVELLHK